MDVDGRFTPSPIEHVDERREKLGMVSLAEYLKRVEATYQPTRQ